MEMGLNLVPALGLECLLLPARTGGKGDDIMKNMSRLQRTHEILGRKQTQVGIDGQDIHFGMQMVNQSSCVAAGDKTEGPVLDAASA